MLGSDLIPFVNGIRDKAGIQGKQKGRFRRRFPSSSASLLLDLAVCPSCSKAGGVFFPLILCFANYEGRSAFGIVSCWVYSSRHITEPENVWRKQEGG